MRRETAPRVTTMSLSAVMASFFSWQTMVRPLRSMRRAAARTLAAQADFSALPRRPMRWKWSAGFFNQHQKFFVAGGAEQGRFNHTAPAKASLRTDKFFQLGQHALVDGGVGDDAPALVHLGLAGL